MNAPVTSSGDPALRAPTVLLPYQQDWVSDPADVAFWEKSRRIGASWCDASDSVLTAAPEGGMDALYIGYSEDMTREYIDDCAMWAKAFNYAAVAMGEVIYVDEGTDIKAFRIDFASGMKILALSSRPRSIRGKQGKVTIDEAAFHDDLPGLLKAALAMLIWGGKVRVMSTHNGDANPFNDLVQDIRAGKLAYSLHRTTFDDAVRQGLYERVKLIEGDKLKEKTEDEWRTKIYSLYGDNSAEELDVVPSEGGGVYLPMAMIESRMSLETPIVRQKWTSAFGLQPEPYRAVEVAAWCAETLKHLLDRLDPARWHGFGEDFARVGDLTVITALEEGADLVQRVRLVVELGNCPFRQQEQILAYIVDRLPRFRAGALDAGGNGASLAEFAADKYGVSRIEQVKLSETFYMEQMPRFKAAFEDATIDALPRDDQCRDDLRAIRKINGVPKLPKDNTQAGDGVAKLQRHGDFAISLFLGHYAMKRETNPGRCDGFESVPRRGAPADGNGERSFARGGNDDDYGNQSRRMM